MRDCSILIGTYGDSCWEQLALERAYPSTQEQGALEVLVAHEPKGNIASVRNNLAARAEGTFLCHLDADDELAPGYLDAMRAEWILRKPQLEAMPLEVRWGLLVPSVQYVHPNGREEPPRIPNEGQWPEVNTCVIGTLIPRALFERVGGFREGYEPYEDYETFLRCWRAGARLVEVRSAVYRAFVHPQSAHRNPAGVKHRRDLHRRILAEHEALRSVPSEV